jgi:hypothetical protein
MKRFSVSGSREFREAALGSGPNSALIKEKHQAWYAGERNAKSDKLKARNAYRAAIGLPPISN